MTQLLGDKQKDGSLCFIAAAFTCLAKVPARQCCNGSVRTKVGASKICKNWPPTYQDSEEISNQVMIEQFITVPCRTTKVGLHHTSLLQRIICWHLQQHPFSLFFTFSLVPSTLSLPTLVSAFCDWVTRTPNRVFQNLISTLPLANTPFPSFLMSSQLPYSLHR